ncbi:MAG: branched-chain amino acid ABC transporter permease [Deltaproteobacteria bacterium]|jgi:branched-chain amino acid transport system permease protein|nr:branched-chain amino acid ABC transporter permease [Deltaproteobacteria bacterium]MBT4644651.1 branched-chain amino acid ABC transporter permease [Deltaproteobacteria bacterium]
MSPIVAMYVAQAIHGLAYGMLLFLVASGLTLIFGMMGVLNLAHASFFMLAAYLCYESYQWVDSFWVALLVAPIIVAFVGILIERFFLRRLERGDLGHIGQILLTLGVSLMILGVVKIRWSTEPLVIRMPESLEGLVNIFGLEYPIYRLFIIAISLLILGILSFLLYKTRLGKIVRAAVTDADMVDALGINIPLVFTSIFGIGTWMAGVAGVVSAPMLSVFPGLADQIGMDAFVVVIVGGFGSLLGALLASLVFGELNSFGVQFIPRLAPVLMFLFMVLVLSFKPTGFFGDRE